MTLKSIYNSYHGPKCSYVRFCLRISKGWKPDDAIVVPRIYKKETRTPEKLQQEIDKLKEDMTQHKKQHDKYRALQKEKDRLVRILSVYKNK